MYARSTQQISIPNLGIASILLHLVRVNFVYEIVDWKNCLNYDTDGLLASSKMRKDPLGVPPCVRNFCSF